LIRFFRTVVVYDLPLLEGSFTSTLAAKGRGGKYGACNLYPFLKMALAISKLPLQEGEI
jgi:hypothetical protein